jgi:hypothetical protein
VRAIVHILCASQFHEQCMQRHHTLYPTPMYTNQYHEWIIKGGHPLSQWVLYKHNDKAPWLKDEGIISWFEN